METYNEKDMKEAGIDIHFVQDNQSMSTKGVLRGLHFQKQYPQCKLVRAVRGTVFDVAVDLRSDSTTYGKWYGVTLLAENKKQFLIPEGFAHGFLVLSDETEFCYKVNDFWHPNDEGGMDETKVDGVTRINDHEFEFHNAHCFKIDIPQIGPAQAIYYDVAALKACCKYIKEHRIKHPIVYIMACRIGPFAGHFYKEVHKLGGAVYLNPDGHEWMRVKWSAPIRKYWKISEQMMVKYCDLAICDSVNIEKYIHECYDGKGIKGRNPKTTFIAYGADLTLSKLVFLSPANP